MKNLWIFGDSFSAGNGSLPNEIYELKYKKSETDIIWPEKLSKLLNYKLINRAAGLYSNDKIIDSIIEVFDNIQQNDIVIIQKSFTHRFDIPNEIDNVLLTISPNSKHMLMPYYNNIMKKKYNKFEMEAIEYIAVTMDNELIQERQAKRFDFLEKLIKNKRVKKCFVWDIMKENNPANLKYETITEASGGSIDDNHWSYKGHSDFTDWISNELITKII